MSLPKNRKSYIAISAVAAFLSVAFVLLIVGPVFLYGQEPQTEGTTLGGGDIPTTGDVPANPDAPVSWDPSSDVSGGVWGVPSAAEQRAAQTGEFGTPEEEVARAGAAEAAARKAREDQAAELAKAFSCMGGGLTSPFFLNLKGCVANLMDMVMWIAARTLWIAGVLLNMTLHLTLNFNTLLEQLPIVDIGWKVLRDIANIVFIFVTLWAGISITLGIGDGGKKAWGLLAQMVLVALFINFSLFITKAIVDASNIAALHFYSLIVEPGKEKDYDSGLSEAFMYGLKLSTLYNAKQIGSGEINADASIIATASRSSNLGKLSFTNIILIGFFGSLFIVVAAWVFFAAAIMFIYRAITLIMLMLLSPLAFVGLILPGASGMAHQWWSKLWSQAFFAPLYLALAYVVVRTINGSTFQAFQGTLPGSTPGTGFAAALTTTSFGPVSVIFNFVILIGLMVACLIVAQSLGAKGSEMAMAGWEKIKGVAVGGVVGVTGAAARGIIKAPSTVIQGAGNIGKAAKWMANTRLLNNKFVNFKSTKLAQRMDAFGTRFQSEEGGGAKIRRWTSKAEWLDPRYMEERAKQSWLGNTMVGKAVRSVTTGAMANVKIGSKSLQEAYEEGEHDITVRRDIEHGANAKRDAENLGTFQKTEEQKREELHHAEAEEAKNKTELDAATTAYEEAKTKGLGKAEIDTAKAKVDEAAEKVQTSSGKSKGLREALEKWEQATAKERGALAIQISNSLARMTPEGFLNLPKHFFKLNTIMDPEVLGSDKYHALMASDHFSYEEKEEYTHARTERLKKQGLRMKDRNEWLLKERLRWQRDQTGWEKRQAPIAARWTGEIEVVDREIKEVEEKIAYQNELLKDAERAGDTGKAAKHKEEIEKAKAVLDERREYRKVLPSYQKEDEQKQRLRDAEGNKILDGRVLGDRPKSQGWESPAIRKALRNLRNPQEILDYYRYDRDLINIPPFVQTVMQGMWNKIRESEAVDSGTKEKIRVDKRLYLQEASDFRFGLDPVIMKRWEEIDPAAAQELRNELNKFIQENSEEGFYDSYFRDGKLNELLEARLPKSLKDRVTAEERRLRNETGRVLMNDVSQNLASDEFTMMSGTLRNLHWVQSILNRSMFSAFKDRDLDVKLPDIQNLIKRAGEMFKGQNELSKGNIDFLVWLVNERGGKEFIPYEQLELTEKEKKLWEAIKALAKQRDDFLGSTFKNKNAALRWLKENGYHPKDKPLRSPWRAEGIKSREEQPLTDDEFYSGI